MIKAKKSLGQNFLKDDSVVEKIIEASNLRQEDIVLEVGPGEGVLTEKLSEKSGKVLAVELDERLIALLRSKLRNKKNVEILHGDILNIKVADIISRKPLDTGYKVVANLPYYITSPILRYFLENEIQPKEMIVMVQKEVAERITSQKGAMSILAIAVQYYARVEYLFTVPKTAFEPMPKVDSAVIRITVVNKLPAISKEETKKFFQIVRAGFSAKRKTLANNLANGLHKDKKEVEDILEKQGFSKMVRAQELGVEDWKKLSAYFS